jgi:hypothetical protein
MRRTPIDPDTVDVLYETVKDLAAAEENRGRSFNERAGSLLGFNGVILALAGAQGALILKKSLGPVGTPLAGAVLLLAVIATGASAFSCVGVLQPRESWHIDMSYIERFPTKAFATADRTWVRGSLMRGLIRQMADERDTNNAKRRHIRAAFRWLLVSLLLLGVEVGILALRSFGA